MKVLLTRLYLLFLFILSVAGFRRRTLPRVYRNRAFLLPNTNSRSKSKLHVASNGNEVHREFSSNMLHPNLHNEQGDFFFSKQGSQIDLLYDSECPICMMEVNFLQKRDINNRIKFTDLSSPSYEPLEHGNVQFADGMRKLRAVLPDGNVVIGVEVFRQTYEAIGLGWVFQITKLPIIGQIADIIYDIWAENRLRITGRGDLADLLKARATTLSEVEPVSCEDSCGIDYGDDDDSTLTE